jgi:hypothetical protein
MTKEIALSIPIAAGSSETRKKTLGFENNKEEYGEELNYS